MPFAAMVTTRSSVPSAPWLLPAILSTTAGSVDVIGFLALGGLFTAHITGNLVVLAAHYVIGGFSKTGPLLSVPVFVAVLGAAALTFGAAEDPRAPRRALLILQAALLAGFLGLGAVFGPFADANSGMAVLAGMLGVSAMAIQNALVRLALPGSPSTAVLTTNTTQLVTDMATVARGRVDPGELAQARRRASVTAPCIAGFLAGCAAGAYLEIRLHLLALVLPVILAVLAIPLGELWNDGRAAQDVASKGFRFPGGELM
jgi:uncharacterized membrane protein YoaK (UPF0700 family)